MFNRSVSLAFLACSVTACFRTVSDIPPPTEGVTVLGRLVSNQLDRLEKQPVPGMRVSLSGLTDSAQTNEEGRFQFFRVPLGELQVRISRADEYGRVRTLKIIDDLNAISDGQVINLGDVELFGTGDLEGSVRLIDQSTESAGEGTLVVVASTPFRAVVDDLGKYRINDLPEGRLELVAFRPGYSPGRVSGIQVKAGNLQLVKEIVLEPGESENVEVAGEVYLSESDDHSGVSVLFESATSSATFTQEVISLADGSYTFSLPIGIYNVSFNKDAYVRSILSGVVVLSEGTLGLRKVYLGKLDPTDNDGDGIPDDKDPDDDNDGCKDELDQFPLDPEVCVDTDNDGIGDALDDDDDNDGLSDAEEQNIGVDGWITNPENPDTDGDGVRDAQDLCPTLPDPEQTDRDMDGLGDSCDPYVEQDPPQITDFFPREGSVGTRVFIQGLNFNTSVPRYNAIIFGEGGFASPESYDSSKGLSVVVPEGAKSGFITLYNAFGSTTSTMSFSVFPRPVLYEAVPLYARPGQFLEILGANLSYGNLQVWIAGTAVPYESLQVYNPNSNPPIEKFSVRIPALPPGPAEVTVRTRGGESSQSVSFEVSGRPAITLMQPNPVARGGKLFVFGTEMTSSIPNSVTQISFASENTGQRTLADARIIREGLLDVTVPLDAVSGPVQLVLPTVTTTSAASLEVDLRLPSIEFLSETVVTSGDSIQISGYNLNNPQAVRFAGIVGNITSSNSGQIVVTVPTTTVAGHVEIDFTVSGLGSYTARSPEPFHILTTSPAFTLPASPNQHLLGINGIGSEILMLVGQSDQRDFELRRYNAETLNEISRVDFSTPSTTLPVSLDVSPNGLYGIVSTTDGSSVGGYTNETVFIFPISNPLGFVTCTGTRELAPQRPRSRAFVFDSQSQFAYGISGHGLGNGEAGIFRIDLRTPTSISCDTFGRLANGSGHGGIAAVTVSDDDRSLLVLDRTLGLSHLNIVSTSTVFEQYSNWKSVSVGNSNVNAEQIFKASDPNFVWIPSTNTRLLLRYDLMTGSVASSIFGVTPTLGLVNGMTTDRRWYVQSVSSTNRGLAVVDLPQRRIATEQALNISSYRGQIISHPVENRFFVKRSNSEVIRMDIISP